MRIAMLMFSIGLLTTQLSAQSEADLKTALEGRSVLVKLDMPATKDGIDVYPQEHVPFNTEGYAKRLKRTGTALWAGQSALITKIKLKGKHIEFQLAGGGYGTFGDDTDPGVDVDYPEETEREHKLKHRLENADPQERKRIRNKLEDLEQQRLSSQLIALRIL